MPEALDVRGQLVDDFPRSARALGLRAYLLMGSRDLEGGALWLERAKQQDPHVPEGVMIEMNRLAREQGRTALALRASSSAIQGSE